MQCNYDTSGKRRGERAREWKAEGAREEARVVFVYMFPIDSHGDNNEWHLSWVFRLRV